jgi:glycerophosphoryl diester phosphodiesterase
MMRRIAGCPEAGSLFPGWRRALPLTGLGVIGTLLVAFWSGAHSQQAAGQQATGQQAAGSGAPAQFAPQPAKVVRPLQLVAHRGLFKHAPENTLAAFAACLDLRLGFELDIRRTQDGHLVCMHDEGVSRTTTGEGKVSQLTLARLLDMDAGVPYDAAFLGERVPTLDQVLALLASRGVFVLVALDIKVDDAAIEADVVRLAQKHKVLHQVVFIGRTITGPGVRQKLRATDPKTNVAVLAQEPKDLDAALAEKNANWIYVRFIPSPEQSTRIYQMGKKIFLSGPKVSGIEIDNWRLAREAPVDAMLTDYPLECRQSWRQPARKN